jgi:hypothetical protein
LFSGSTSTEELKRRDLELEKDLKNLQLEKDLKNLELEKDLKLKQVKTKFQVSYPYYYANSHFLKEKSHKGNNSPTQSDFEDNFEVEPPINPQLSTIRKPFKINYKRLNQDIEFEANLERKKVYQERFNLEQKKEIFSKWRELMSKTESEILYFDFVDEYYYLEESQVNTITKEKWVKEDNTIVSSSHPPLESIVISHLQITVKASPFKVSIENIDGKKVIE